jgi:hypothetical protein
MSNYYVYVYVYIPVFTVFKLDRLYDYRIAESILAIVTPAGRDSDRQIDSPGQC